jgi:hypothetical protein
MNPEEIAMSYDPEKLIRIATKLKAAKEQVAALEEQLRSLVLETGNGTQSSVRRRSSSGLSDIAANVVALLEEDPQKSFNAESVWTALDLKENYARPLLSKLAKANIIEKRAHGLYGAIEKA